MFLASREGFLPGGGPRGTRGPLPVLPMAGGHAPLLPSCYRPGLVFAPCRGQLILLNAVHSWYKTRLFTFSVSVVGWF